MAALKEMRIERNLSQEELARKAGIHPVTVSRIESGHSARKEVIEKICRVLEVNSIEGVRIARRLR